MHFPGQHRAAAAMRALGAGGAGLAPLPSSEPLPSSGPLPGPSSEPLSGPSSSPLPSSGPLPSASGRQLLGGLESTRQQLLGDLEARCIEPNPNPDPNPNPTPTPTPNPNLNPNPNPNPNPNQVRQILLKAKPDAFVSMMQEDQLN